MLWKIFVSLVVLASLGTGATLYVNNNLDANVDANLVTDVEADTAVRTDTNTQATITKSTAVNHEDISGQEIKVHVSGVVENDTAVTTSLPVSSDSQANADVSGQVETSGQAGLKTGLPQVNLAADLETDVEAGLNIGLGLNK
jgi:hypothetical protein